MIYVIYENPYEFNVVCRFLADEDIHGILREKVPKGDPKYPSYDKDFQAPVTPAGTIRKNMEDICR